MGKFFVPEPVEFRDCNIQGMESVVATVSGYHGSERFDLIKLISQTGANYVGEMSRSITHLVCWKFEGKKFSLAKKFKILIVNHRWFEDCVKAGKRIPEDSYIMQSGQEIGTLQLEGLLVPKKADLLTKKPRQILLDLSNVGEDSKEPVIDLKVGDPSQSFWTDSCLLNEKLLPKERSNKKVVKKCLKEERPSSIRYRFKEPPLSIRVGIEEGESSSRFSTCSTRRKRDISNASSSTFSAETSCKGRRLVKKDVMQDILKSVHLDSGQEGRMKKNPSRSCDGMYGHGGNRVINLEDVDEIKYSNQNVYSEGLNSCSNNLSDALEEISKDGRSYAEESLEAEVKDGNQIEQINRLPTSTELSCVICWTEFSSTRGVLPCGHRFCYPCIQNWADHMAVRGKISTCPLCKANFVSITKVDDAASSDQKIYSQTIPYAASTTDIFILPYWESSSVGAQSTLAPVCSECQCREPEDLLISCHLCQTRRIHSYCLDPPLFPWTCTHCKDLRTLYHHLF